LLVNRKDRRVLAYGLLIGLGCFLVFSAVLHRAPSPAEDTPPPAVPVQAAKAQSGPIQLNPAEVDDYVVILKDTALQVYPALNTPEAYEIHTVDYGSIPDDDACRGVEQRDQPKRDASER
jgi:hypothetical protein